MTHEKIAEILENALGDDTTYPYYEDYLRAAIDVLGDGEALAKLGITDEDQEEVECLHYYLMQIYAQRPAQKMP
jgi:hypothetical protein